MMRRDRSVNIVVHAGNSEKSIEALIGKKADIASCSRMIKLEELKRARAKGIWPRQYRAALDGIAVIVHPSNRVRELTLDQLRAIYSGEAKSWKDLGGADGRIVALSPGRGREMSLFFIERALAGEEGKKWGGFGAGVMMLRSSKAVADKVSSDPGAIGYVELRRYNGRRHGLVAVGEAQRGPYFRPTVETLFDYRYPLSRPLFFYTNQPVKGKVKEFVDFVLSPDGQAVNGWFGFAPVPAVKRERGQKAEGAG
jgi:phosphate transport system substrate-binding protein